MAPRVRIKTKLNQITKLRDRQVRRANAATVKTLNRFGAIVRQDARKLIGAPAKKSKFTWKTVDGQKQMVVTPPTPPRSPGKPPRARTSVEGANLRTIIYNVDETKGRVKIGPMKLPVKGYAGQTIPELHEFGATITIRAMKIGGSITQKDLRKRKGKLTQVQTRMIIVESKKGSPMVVKMPKRPFMRPAYERHKNKATKIWKEYYRATRGRR